MRGSTVTEPYAGPDIDMNAALDSTLTVLRCVERGDLAKPTPCTLWDVHSLINHFVGTARWWAGVISGDDGLSAADDDYAAGDFVAAYEESIRIARGAFGADGASERMVKVPFGEFPGAAVRGFAATDQFTHGWDLARAVGHDTDLAPDLAVALLDLAKLTFIDPLRGSGPDAPFGPALEAPGGSSAADRLAAFLGRAV
jgi:uncharacterized protein (TIGR03086 family)